MRASFCLSFALFAFTRLASADVWIADDESIYKLDATATQVALSIPSPDTMALAVDPRDSSVWILSDKRLTKRSITGQILFDGDLKAIALAGADRFALDARDGSIWVGPAEGTSGGRVFVHLSSTGVSSGSVVSPESDAEISIALDQSVWLLAKKRLLHYTKTGTLLADIDLKSIIDGEPKLFAVDSIGAWVWISAEKRLARIDSHTLSAPPLSVTAPGNPDLLAYDEIRGVLWVLDDKLLTPSMGRLARWARRST